MARRKHIVLISSKDRTDASDSSSDFSVHLVHPIDGVIRTDLRQVFVGAQLVGQSQLYYGIQSTQLGNRLYSGSEVAMYDVIPFAAPPFTYERWSSKADESVYEKPSMLYQIDLRFVNPDGSTADFGGADVAVLLEVITEN